MRAAKMHCGYIPRVIWAGTMSTNSIPQKFICSTEMVSPLGNSVCTVGRRTILEMNPKQCNAVDGHDTKFQ